MAVYSFKDITAALEGVGGSINLGNGAAIAEEGITVEPVEDKNVMTVGADGAGMHSLIANDSSTVTVRLLKTSPVNAQLQQMYNQQTLSAATHGKNTLTIRDVARGDVLVFSGVAFKRRPALNYAKEGGTVEWVFDALRTSQTLGVGTPAL